MKKNMGSLDRIVRVILALVVGGLYLQGTISGTLGIILLVIAFIFVMTSIVSFCPLYKLFGIKTCPVETPPEVGPENRPEN